jgi:iron complex outermembrane recepter protein
MPRSPTSHRLVAAAVASALSGAAGIAPDAFAQQTEIATLEEVIVTARKVSENLQQVPVAVTALTAGDIEERGIQGLKDIARYTSGFSFENFTGPFAAPTIRGQTQTRIDLPVQNVASFFNGVYLQRNYSIDVSLLDMERVEVIKGPQSALYGRNAFSGAINYVPREAGEEFEARIEGTLGSDEKRAVSGSISFPIGEKFGVLLGGGHNEFDGTWENNHPLASSGNFTRDNTGGYDNQFALATVRFQPIEALSFSLAYSYSDLNIEHVPTYALSTTGLLNSVVVLNCSPGGTPSQNRLYCGEIPADPVLAAAELSGPLARPPGVVVDPRGYGQIGKNQVGSLRTTFDVSETLSLNYLFGYVDAKVNGRGSPTRNSTVGTPLPVPPVQGLVGFDSQPNGGFNSRSHELRLEWTPGGLVRRAMLGGLSSRARDDASAWSRWATPNSLAEPQFTFTFSNQTRRDAVESAFGLVTLDLTPQVSVTGELRWSDEELTLQPRATSPGFIATPLDATSPVLRTQINSFDYTTPRLTVDYRPTETTMFYLSGGKGVKSGGQNAPGRDPLQDIYQPEENWTYELGTKNDLLDGRLRANVAAFFIDWTGIQGSVARNYPTAARTDCLVACAPPAPNTPVPVIVGNLGDAEVYGIELDGAFIATDALKLDYALSWARARYNAGQISQRAANAENCNGIVCAATVRNAIGQPIDGARIGGNTVERQPEYKVAVGGEYQFTIGAAEGVQWSARIDGTWQDKQYVDELNLAWLPSRTLIDASLTARGEKWNARLWARNLFDEEYVSSSLFLIGTDGARSASYVPLLGEKRAYGVTLGWQF